MKGGIAVHVVRTNLSVEADIAKLGVALTAHWPLFLGSSILLPSNCRGKPMRKPVTSYPWPPPLLHRSRAFTDGDAAAAFRATANGR